MREAIRGDSKIMDAHLTLGNWLVRLKKPDEAADAFKAALRRNPSPRI